MKFLQDQRGERKMTMGRLDEEFSKKKASQLKRKLGSAPSSTITSQDILCEDQNKSFGESSPVKDNRDEEFNIQENTVLFSLASKKLALHCSQVAISDQTRQDQVGISGVSQVV